MKGKLIVSALLLCAFLCACGAESAPVPLPSIQPETAQPGPTPSAPVMPSFRPPVVESGAPVDGAPLICIAKSQQEAEAIAEQYGISLVEFSYGVASFDTEEDPRKVIERGKANGWTELSLNRGGQFYQGEK